MTTHLIRSLALVLVLVPAVSFAASRFPIKDPMADARSRTLGHADYTSDVEPWGLDDCVTTSDSRFDWTISCTGTRTQLVLGGHPHTSQFACSFGYDRRADGQYLLIASEGCED